MLFLLLMTTRASFSPIHSNLFRRRWDLGSASKDKQDLNKQVGKVVESALEFKSKDPNSNLGSTT